jgi:hypothetical protein
MQYTALQKTYADKEKKRRSEGEEAIRLEKYPRDKKRRESNYWFSSVYPPAEVHDPRCSCPPHAQRLSKDSTT